MPESGGPPGEGSGRPLQCPWASLAAPLVKNPPTMWETLISIPELGRSAGEENGYPLQYYGLENSMDCIVRGVTESDMTEQLSLSLFLFCIQQFYFKGSIP